MDLQTLNLHLHYEEGQQNVKKDLQIKADIEQSWEQIIDDFKKKVNITSDEQWAFQYFDDEGDCVMGKNESEWRAALKFAETDRPQSKVLHIEAIPLGNVKWDCQPGVKAKPVIMARNTTSQCCPDPSASNCCKGEEEEVSCCKDSADGNDCQFPCKRPIPELGFDVNRPAPEKIENKTQSQYKYTGEALRAVALPLGPIGQGSISIAGDGGLRQWQINNKINNTAHVPDSFFAIRVDTDGTSKSVVLQSAALYDDKSFKPAPFITDHYIPYGSRQLLKDLPGVKTIEVTAQFPTAKVDYTSNEVPVKVEMEAYSPKIPLNSKDSAIPVIIFNFTVTNNTTKDATVTLMGTQQNIAGWNCYTAINNEVASDGYGGNVNSLYTSNKLYGIDMSNPTLKTLDAFNGHVASAFLQQPNDKYHTMLQFDNAKALWALFSGSAGLPGQGHPGVSKSGTTWNGAVACERVVPVGKSTVFTYMLAWHFPNRYKDWRLQQEIPNTPLWVGNQYNKNWKSVTEVLEYTATNFARLQDSTIKFRDAMFNSTSAWQIIDSAANRVGLLNSPTCLWSEDGNFYAFEGCSKGGGCCPLNCTHVWNYEQCLAKVYPDLERTMREVDLFHQINPYGVVPSRSACPLELRRIWDTWANYTTYPSDQNACVDGEIGTVLKAYREVRQGASTKWFNDIWGPVKKIMSRWMNELDKGDGLITVAQPNTYDVSTYGTTAFIGAYYLCALRATEEMAKLQGDTALTKLCNDRFKIGSANLDKACFPNGKWYTQLVDPAHEVQLLTDATFMDSLVGQWWAHSLGLGYLLPAEHIKSNLKYAAARNYVKSFDPAKQYPRKFADQRDSGYFLGVWDEGPPKNQLYYTNEFCWTGVLHAFVGLCFYEGLYETGLTALTTLRQCYDGTRRSPWNEIECGDYYARAMAAFLYFEIANGQEWQYVTESAINLKFAPRFTPEAFRGFFILGSSWGQYSQILDDSKRNGIAKVEVQYGTLELAELRLSSSTSAAIVTLNEKVLPEVKLITKTNGEINLKFPSIIKVHEGQTLTVNLLG